VNIRAFPAFPQDRRAVPTGVTIPSVRTAVGQLDLAVFLGIFDALLPSVDIERMIIGVSCWCGWWLRP
jgi:hypothetical protein